MYVSPFESQLNSLEEFWESEHLRVGEPGATGWASWLTSGSPDPDAAQIPRRTADPPATDPDPYRRWASLELSADRSQHLPKRTLTTDDEDSDPYSTILFSDIRPLLVPLHTPQAAHAFRLVWLAFLGLHVPGLATLLGAAPDNTDDRWAATHLSSPSYLSAIFPETADFARLRITADAQAGVLIGREREYKSGFGPIKYWGAGVFDALEGVGEGPGTWRMWMREDVAGIDQTLVREIFRQCQKTGVEGIEWNALAVAFEAAVNTRRYCDSHYVGQQITYVNYSFQCYEDV